MKPQKKIHAALTNQRHGFALVATVMLMILFLLVLIPVAAQDAPEKPARDIQVRAMAFSLFENIDKLQLRIEERVVGELEVSTDQLRNRTSVSARTFTYGVEKDDFFKVLGKAVLPDVGRNFILVLVPTKTGYRAIPVRADDPDFHGDDMVVFNFTQHKIRVMLGTANKVILPSENAKLRPAFPEDATFYQALLTYEKDETFIPFSNNRWPVNSNTKALLFVFTEPETGNLAYRSVTMLAKPR